MVISFESLAFFRGVSKSMPMDQVTVHKVRKFRQPRNSEQEFHDLADDWFLRKFGVRYRSTSLFVTSSLQHAARYAESAEHIVRIIPLSNYSYCWSPDLEDLTYAQSRLKPFSQKVVDSYLDKAGYRETDLQGAHASGNELMLLCESYMAIPISCIGVEAPLAPSLIIP